MLRRRRIMAAMGGGAAAWTPESLSGVTAWLKDAGTFQDAAKTTLADDDGEAVGAHADQSGNGNDATQATAGNKPTYKTNIQNSKSSVRYATDDYLDFGNTGSPLIPQTANFAVYGAVKTGAQVTNEETILAQYISLAGNGRITLRISSSQLQLILGNDSTEATVTLIAGSVSANTAYYFSFRREGNTFTGRINGVDGTPNADAEQRDILQAGNLIGARTNGSTGYNNTLVGFLNADFLELVVQVATPSADDLDNMDTYLNDAWSINP